MRLRYLQLAAAVLWLGTAAMDATAAESVHYRFGLLRRGPGYTSGRTPQTDSVQAGHMANIRRMAAHGALLSAGPFEDGGELRGVFVFRSGDDDLDSLMSGDPAISSQRLVCEVHDWIAPPGLGDDYRARAAQGGRDSMITLGMVLLRRGPRYDSNPSPGVLKLIERQNRYSEKLKAAGHLIFAGAIQGTGDLRGILLFKGDKRSVERLMKADPAVRAGRLAPQVLTWWTAFGTIPGH